MKKKNIADIVIVAATSLFALIAICCFFARGFDETTRGTGFEVIFGFYNRRTNVVPELVVAFVLQCLGVILPWFVFALKGKAKGGLFAFIAAMLVASAVLLLFSKQLYAAHNDAINVDFDLGAGFISSIVFDFLGALVVGIGAFAGLHKTKEVED